MRRSLPPAILALASGLGALALDARSSRAEEPVRRLELPRRARGGRGSLDWVIERVESAEDRFASERASERIGARLDELAAIFVAPAGAGESAPDRAIDRRLAGFVAPEFRGALLLPHESDLVLDRDGTSAWRDRSADASRTVDRGAFAGELARLGALTGRVRKAKFKVFGFRTGRADDAAAERVAAAEERAALELVETSVLLELDGDDAAGGFAQVRTVWDLGWRLRDGDWQLVSLARRDFERARVASRLFADVTEHALGSETSWREQLSRGVGWWRTRVDSASGIDIYGHQGLAIGDVDGDELDDLFVAQPAGLPNRLFRNRGDGRFEDVSRQAGVDALDNTGGALLVDLDGDGDRDLVAVTSLEALLFENDGRGVFHRRAASGLETVARRSASTLGAAAADFDLDGDLDLYVFSYVFWAGGASKRHSSYPWPYHDANNGAPNFLLRNEGGLRFRDVTDEVGLSENNQRFSLAASWADYDDDGDPDLYVANDFGKNNLYRNDRGRFRDVAAELGVDDVGNGMSVTWEDFDNDGRLDLYVGNMWSSAGGRIAGQPEFLGDELRATYLRMARGNSLYRNLGDGRFEDVSIESGAYFGRWSWSAQFLDVEGDGFEDLYVVNGFVTNEKQDDL